MSVLDPIIDDPQGVAQEDRIQLQKKKRDDKPVRVDSFVLTRPSSWVRSGTAAADLGSSYSGPYRKRRIPWGYKYIEGM